MTRGNAIEERATNRVRQFLLLFTHDRNNDDYNRKCTITKVKMTIIAHKLRKYPL